MMMNKYGSFIIPFILISCLIITGLMLYQNVQARSREIALLKAMGTATRSILLMILSKAVFLGIIGTLAGFLLGHMVAEYSGSEIFRFTAMNIKPVWSLFYAGLIIFPFLWMLAGWIPALIASQIDAAKTLGQE